jgi:hypothetical protein
MSMEATATAISAGAYTYAAATTPVISNVDPSFGTAAGGTTITIRGSSLPADVADAAVVVDGVNCDITAASASEVVCTSGVRQAVPSAASFSVHSRTHGSAVLAGHTFRYMDRWSSRVTWAGEPPPKEDESIIIPAGQAILYDLPASPRLRLVLIEGHLEFDDTLDVSLDAHYILVRGPSATFAIGSEARPFTHRATITLHGRRATAKEIPGYGAKNLAVRYGTLDLHGAPKTPSWTRLGMTAARGSRSITLAEAVNWGVGDEVVVASSSWGPEEAEKRRVTGVSSDNRTLDLDQPLRYSHWGAYQACGPFTSVPRITRSASCDPCKSR